MRARAMENGDGSDDVSDPDVPSDGKFDVIITDSSEMVEDPSPNDVLFQEEYFQNIKGVIRAPHGIVSSLGRYQDSNTVHFIYTVFQLNAGNTFYSYSYLCTAFTDNRINFTEYLR